MNEFETKLKQDLLIMGFIVDNPYIHSFSTHQNLEIINYTSSEDLNRFLVNLMEVNKSFNPDIQFFKISNNIELNNIIETLKDREEFYHSNLKRLVIFVEDLKMKDISEILYNNHGAITKISFIVITEPEPKSRKKKPYINSQYQLIYRATNATEPILVNEEQELVISL